MKRFYLSIFVVSCVLALCYYTHQASEMQSFEAPALFLQNVEAFAQKSSDEEQTTKTIKGFTKVYKCVPQNKPNRPLNVVGYAADCTPFETTDLSRKDECKESTHCPSYCNTYE
ncbi:MAG: hypothetical protein IJ767_02475 [Bacteroidaceae bacterium]|nr:hypothetical protein [Bacteroidaceae bacterium]